MRVDCILTERNKVMEERTNTEVRARDSDTDLGEEGTEDITPILLSTINLEERLR